LLINTNKIREMVFEGIHVYPVYRIKQKELSDKTFDPSTFTLNAIDTILHLYGKPKNPSTTNWTYIPVNYKGIPQSETETTLKGITKILVLMDKMILMYVYYIFKFNV